MSRNPSHILPGGIPQDLLDTIISLADDNDILSLLKVNSAFYLAAKPHVFRHVILDHKLQFPGANHGLEDTYADSGRPIFLRDWLLRWCTTLDVDVHDSTACATFPRIDGVTTLHLPYDTHGHLATGTITPLTACCLHKLRPAAIVHKEFRFHDRPGTSSTFPTKSIKTYTALISATNVTRHITGWWFDPLAPAFTSTVAITYVFPHKNPSPTQKVLPPVIPPEQPTSGLIYHHGIYCNITATACNSWEGLHSYYWNAAWATRFFWTQAAHFGGVPQVVFVGLDEITGDATNTQGHSHTHIAYLTRAVLYKIFLDSVLSGSICDHTAGALIPYLFWTGPNCFRILQRSEWMRSEAGKAALTASERAKLELDETDDVDHAEWELHMKSQEESDNHETDTTENDETAGYFPIMTISGHPHGAPTEPEGYDDETELHA